MISRLYSLEVEVKLSLTFPVVSVHHHQRGERRGEDGERPFDRPASHLLGKGAIRKSSLAHVRSAFFFVFENVLFAVRRPTIARCVRKSCRSTRWSKPSETPARP